MNALHLNGNDLTLESFAEVVQQRRPVLLEPSARIAVERARAVVDDLVVGDRVAYAITTGVGKLADVRISADQARELQINLVRSHAVGVGEPLSQEEARGMCLLRANSLAKGFSGVRPVVIDTLCEMLNRGVHPVIPSQGSVGASGDLAPLSHLALVLIGEGEAWYEGKRMSGAEAMKAAGITSITLEAKEAISLINGTQAMLSSGSLSLIAAQILADTADVIGSISLDALQGTDVAFDERIHAARPHPGQVKVAANLRMMMEGSALRERHRDCTRVQDAYSMRCMPQVHGAVRDALAYARQTFEIEMNSAVDNPLVFAAPKKVGAPRTAAPQAAEGDILSGGNFHGEPIAFALDMLAIALTAIAGISERRIERLVNPQLSEGLPPFLAPTAGLNSGFMMPQVTAAALVSENKVLAHPASVDSITTSGNKEDYVSMGMTGALKLKRVVENTRNVLAIEALAAAQAVDCVAPLKPSRRAQRALNEIRAVSPMMQHDRSLAKDFALVSDVIAKGKIAAALY
ncbi:MAG TPA: histidine ammonia-lyase [candidate division Zixibacteria bacterium]|nr:histidine ammonia-lyase [candidate division Zixibacteria bacterium]